MLDRTIAPEVRPFDFRALPLDRVEKLPNGLTLHILRGGTQSVGQLSAIFAGGTYDLPGKCEPLMAPQLLSEGAGEYDGAEIADRLDMAGARMSPVSSHHYSGLSTIVLSHCLPDVLPLLKAMIEAPHFSSAAVENARRIMIAQLNLEKSRVMHHASAMERQLVLGKDHPGSLTQTPADVEAVSPESLREFHRRLICPAKAHAFLCGGFGDQTIDTVKHFLMDLKDLGGEPIAPYCPEPRPDTPQTRVIEMPDAVQTAVCMGIPAIDRHHPDFIPLRLAVMALGGYFGSRLMTNIREEKGLTYHIESYLAASDRSAEITISAQCNSEMAFDVVSEVKKELSDLAANPPSAGELRRLKLHAMSSLMETLDSPISVMNYRQLEVTIGMPRNYFDEQQRVITSITPKIISEMAEKYLKPENLRIAIAGNVTDENQE